MIIIITFTTFFHEHFILVFPLPCNFFPFIHVLSVSQFLFPPNSVKVALLEKVFNSFSLKPWLIFSQTNHFAMSGKELIGLSKMNWHV